MLSVWEAGAGRGKVWGPPVSHGSPWVPGGQSRREEVPCPLLLCSHQARLLIWGRNRKCRALSNQDSRSGQPGPRCPAQAQTGPLLSSPPLRDHPPGPCITPHPEVQTRNQGHSSHLHIPPAPRPPSSQSPAHSLSPATSLAAKLHSELDPVPRPKPPAPTVGMPHALPLTFKARAAWLLEPSASLGIPLQPGTPRPRYSSQAPK